MNGFAEHKVSGGKLVQAMVRFDLVIHSVRFSGDFFLHPEETLAFLEESLKNQALPASEPLLEKLLTLSLDKNHACLVGASPVDFAKVVLEAVQNGK